MPCTYVISNVNDEKIIGTSYEKDLQEASQKEFRIERVIKVYDCMPNGRYMIIHSIA